MAQVQRNLSDGKLVLEEIDYIMSRMKKLYDACDEYLTDPKAPDKYTLIPYAHELDILYTIEETMKDARGGSYTKTVKIRDNLKNILDRVMDQVGGDFVEVKYKHADPRRLIIDTAAVLTKQLETIARIHGLIKEGVTINITQIQQWAEIKMIIFDATKNSPEIRQRIVNGLAQIAGA